MKGIVSPETILDHVIAYTIGAGEVIQESLKNKLRDSSKYDMSLVPYGPPFYTAILQAAGALSIDQKKETTVIVYQQNIYPENILLYKKPIGPILGKTFSFPAKVASLFTKNKLIKTMETIHENIENQIYFIRILCKTKNIILLGVGDKVQKEDNIKILEKISKTTETSIFFIANLSQEKTWKTGKEEDEKTITKIIARTYKPTKNDSGKISELFSDISRKNKRIPEIVAYSNTGDLGGDKKKTNGYACFIA